MEMGEAMYISNLSEDSHVLSHRLTVHWSHVILFSYILRGCKDTWNGSALALASQNERNKKTKGRCD
jgi:hypothetical protein